MCLSWVGPVAHIPTDDVYKVYIKECFKWIKKLSNLHNLLYDKNLFKNDSFETFKCVEKQDYEDAIQTIRSRFL